MLLEEDHPLSKLEDGFRVKEALKLNQHAFVDRGGSPVKLVELNVSQEQPKTPVYKALRDFIPYTKGRIVPWKMREHVMSAKARNWPGLKLGEFKNETLIICGGGPSIGELEQIKQIRALQKKGGKVLAINRTHDWLFTKGIVPWAGILLDPVPAVANYICPRRGVRYYVGSQCHPDTFSVFDKPDLQKVIWHAASIPELQEWLTPHERIVCVPANGSTCGLRSILLGYLLGFREIHLFGMDSSYPVKDGKIVTEGGKPKLHAYSKPEAIHDVREMVIPYPDGEKVYYGNTMMLSQADEFQEFLLVRDRGLESGMLEPHKLYVHGYGVIPDIARFYGLHYDQRKVNK
jgi:hypothetical protein